MVKKIVKSAIKKKAISEEENSIENLIDNCETDHPVTKKLWLDWAYYYSMYLGFQAYVQSYEDNELIEDEIAAESRSIYNIIDGFCDTYVAKMLKDRPIPQFYPLGFESKDINAARYSNIAIESWWKKIDMSAMWYDVLFWAACLGTGIIKQYYNDAQETDGVIAGAEQNPLRRGDISAESLMPWNYIPDPRATSGKSQRYGIHFYAMPITTFKRIFKDKEGIEKISEEVIEDYREMLASHSFGSVDSESSTDGVFSEKCVMVREYWERAIDGFDAGQGVGKGRFMIRAGKQTWHDGPNPYKKTLPFIVCAIGKTPDQFWGRGLVEKMAPEQHDLNRINSLIMENIDWTCIVKYAVPKGLNIEDNTINKKSGEVVEYDSDGGPGPHQMVIAGMPQYVFEHKASIFSTVMDRTGMHEVSFAQLPPRASQTSGKALNQLVEAEATRFAKDVVAIQTAMEEQALFFIELAQEHYTETQHVALMGQYRGVEIADFKGADLRGQTGCFVEVGSSLGMSPSAKFEKMVMLFDRKVIGPDELMKSAEFGTTGKVFYQTAMDDNKANRHLQSIIKDHVAPNISKYDNHQAIIKVFMDFIRKPEYDELDDKTRQVIETYMDTHKEKEAEIMAQTQAMVSKVTQGVMQKAGMAGGQIPPGGPGGQPPQMMTPQNAPSAMQDQMSMATGQPGAPPPQEG